MARTRSGSPLVETLAAFVVVFALQQFGSLIGAGGLVSVLFVLSAPIDHDPWTIVTSIYAHVGTAHLLSNGVALIVFGWPVARATTRVKFHAFFVATGALAGVAQILLTSSPGVVGASGAVFALMGYLLAANRLSATFAGLIRPPRWLTLLAFVGLAAVITLATAAPRVALVAHFTGFLLGLVAGRMRVLRP